MKYTIYFLTFLYQLSLISAGPQININCPIWDPTCLIGPEQLIATFIATTVPQLARENLDPLSFDTLPIVNENLEFYISNLRVQGLENLVIDDVSVDASSRVIRMLFHTDFVMNMDYITNGTLLSMPIYGEGNYTLTLENVQIDMDIPYDVTTDDNGSDTIDLQSFSYTFVVRDGAQFALDNLYYGNETLSNNMHQALEENWQFITEMYGGYLFDEINNEIVNSLGSVLSATSLDTIGI